MYAVPQLAHLRPCRPESSARVESKTPKAPEPGVRDADPINLTGQESRLVPVHGGGIKQTYHTRAAVDAQAILAAAERLTQVINDKPDYQ